MTTTSLQNINLEDENYKNKYISINIVFNTNSHHIIIASNKLIKDLVNKIEIKLHINIQNYLLIYNNQTINLEENIILSSLFQNEKEIKIYLEKNELKDSLFKYSSIDVIIEKIPSIIEMLNLLDEYNKLNNNSVKYKLKSKNRSKIIINFIDNEMGFSFIQYLTNIKFNNSLYKNIKIKLNYPKIINNNNSNLIKKFENKNILKNNNSNLNLIKQNKLPDIFKNNKIYKNNSTKKFTLKETLNDDLKKSNYSNESLKKILYKLHKNILEIDNFLNKYNYYKKSKTKHIKNL